jgi:LmbE family N-acetylglucosaminyl deacetylase
MFKNILVIGSHYDDIEIGCGGTIAKLINNGSDVTAVIITNSEIKNSEKKIIRSKKIAKFEGMKGLNLIGIKKIINFDINIFDIELKSKTISRKLNKIITNNNFDTLFTHWTHDPHLDHKEIAKISIWLSRKIKNIFQYRSNYYSAEVQFFENYIFDISSTLEIKKKALLAHKSEMTRYNYKWYDYFINKSLNDGIKINTKAAESFFSYKITN